VKFDVTFGCDRKVEDTILRILRDRKLDCYFFHHYVPDKVKYCQKEEEDYKTAETNWFAKCKQFCLFIIHYCSDW